MSDLLQDIVEAESLAHFQAAGPVKHGLPAEAYVSQRFFELEQDRVFARSWTLSGFAHELPSAGDVLPITVAGRPIVLVRGKDGLLRAFHNVCRHRGLKLVDAPCSGRRRLVCPYHNWSYALDGSLINATNFGGHGVHGVEGFDYETHGLAEVPCRQWHDWIFVNVAGNEPDFESFLAPLIQQLGAMDLGRMEYLYKIDSGIFECNWKFICENFIEPYHVPVVHPETAAGQPLEQHYMVRDAHLVGCAVDIDERPQKTARGRDICLDISARYLLLFPNFLFFIYFGPETHINVMLNVPLAAGRTHQRRVIYQLGGSRPDTATIGKWRALTHDVIAEDRAMVERLQEGRRSPVLADGGVLSPVWEASERAFQDLIMAAVLGPAESRPNRV
jgi:choline monooxygenase